MELTKENKRNIYIIGAIVLVLFVVGLMLKFWIHTVIAIASFVGGYFYAKRGGNTGKNDSKKKGFL